jgi:hypothetical protein
MGHLNIANDSRLHISHEENYGESLRSQRLGSSHVADVAVLYESQFASAIGLQVGRKRGAIRDSQLGTSGRISVAILLFGSSHWICCLSLGSKNIVLEAVWEQ